MARPYSKVMIWHAHPVPHVHEEGDLDLGCSLSNSNRGFVVLRGVDTSFWTNYLAQTLNTFSSFSCKHPVWVFLTQIVLGPCQLNCTVETCFLPSIVFWFLGCNLKYKALLLTLKPRL